MKVRLCLERCLYNRSRIFAIPTIFAVLVVALVALGAVNLPAQTRRRPARRPAPQVKRPAARARVSRLRV